MRLHLIISVILFFILKENAHSPADKIVSGINRRLDEFVKTEELHDDITMVAIKVK